MEISFSDMIDYITGGFYVCTEISPRCFIIQKIGAKGLHNACNDSNNPSSLDGDCNRCLSEERYTSLNAQGDCGESIAGTTGDCVEEENRKATMTMTNGIDDTGLPNDYYASAPVSRQDSETIVNSYGYGLSDQASNQSVNLTDEHMRIPVEQLASGANADHHILVSPQDCHTTIDGQGINGVLRLAADGTTGVAQGWPVYGVSYEDLKTRVRHQLEYYFSRENLASDAYLRSQMDNDQFVKVTVLSNFNMVRRLTTDMNMIIQALRESSFLQMDETGEKVRPVHKRCTLILREIPEDTEKKEVEDLFASPTCPKITSCEYALNNIWYVNFETDEDAQKAFLYLRQQVQNFKGKPILARIKTAPIPRVQNGYRPVPPSTLALQNPQQSTSPTSATTAANSVGAVISPGLEAAASTIALPLATSAVCAPAAVSAVVGVMTPGGESAAGCVGTSSVTLPGAAPIAAVPPSNIYYYSAAQPAAIVTPAAGHASAVVAAPAAAVISPSWPPASPSFDLGYILAVNGYQPQGAYRPALLVPAAPIPAQVAATVGHRFLTDRPPRRQRTSGSYYSSRGAERNSVDNGQSATASATQSRYGQSGSARPSGSYGEGRTYHRSDQNIHYNSIRNRPNRQGSINGSTGNSNGVPSARRYQPRAERYPGADYWSSSTSGTKERKAASNSTTGMNSAGISGSDANGKKMESFDLESSAFPPLPTANAEQNDSATPAGSQSAAVVPNNLSEYAVSQVQQGQQGEAVNDASLVKSSSMMANGHQSETVAKVQNANHNAHSKPETRFVNAVAPQKAERSAGTEEMNNGNDGGVMMKGNETETVMNTTTITHENQFRDQMMVQKPMSTTTAAGAVVRGGTTTTIPVAVVVPNTQPKPQRVTTADKATATDSLAHIPKKGLAEGRNSSVATMTNSQDTNDAAPMQDGVNDYAKRLSYAEMAKHAAVRNANFSSGANAIHADKAIQNSANAASAAAGVGKDQRELKEKEEGSRRWPVRGTNAGPANGRGNNYQRDQQNKYNGRKQQKQYRKRDFQQQQQEYSMSQHAMSPAPSSG